MAQPQTVLDLFHQKQSREEWLREARATAAGLLRTRFEITIEDVLRDCPRPHYLHRNITGLVFKDPRFKHVGFTKSHRAISNSRIIGLWGLRDIYVPTVRELRRTRQEAQ